MNYRPIAPASHIGMIMEIMIPERLAFYMESERNFNNSTEWIQER